MFQLNTPNKGGNYSGNTIQYKIVPWFGGLWFAPLRQGTILSSNQAFAQIYNLFTGDSDTPTKKGQYKVINNLDAYTFYKRNPTSPNDTLNNPDMVLPPRGVGMLWAGGATVGIVSNVAGWDNITQRHNNEWYRGPRGPSAGIYLYDADGEIQPPDHISSDTTGQRVYDTADFIVGGASQFVPNAPTKVMPSAGSVVANGFNGDYCIQLCADGSIAPQNYILLPIPTAGKSQLTVDLNIVNVFPVGSNPADFFELEILRVDADGNSQPQLLVSHVGDQLESISINAGSGLSNLVNCTIVSGATQFALGDAIYFILTAASGGGSTDWYLTLKATVT